MRHAQRIPVLVTENLTKYYGKARGIQDVSLTVEEGDVFGFIGPNGAGKSTTIRIIMGLLFPGSGQVRLFGEDALSKGAELRNRIGFIPSELNYYDKMKTGALLNYAADLYGVSDRGKIGEYSERLKLDLSRRINDLSLGNKKKVAIIQALIHRPELLICDEPTSGLDPLIQSRFYEILREEQQRGCTIFFSSHTLSEVERLCSKVAIISEGKIIKTSGMDELKQLYLKKFQLIFQKGSHLKADELGILLPGASDITVTPRGAEGLCGGNIQELLKQLSVLPIEDVVLEDPGLEEIFMYYYRDGEDA
jgi:ABC-2 type transport system ATP-binding protein